MNNDDITYEETIERHRKSRHKKLMREAASVFAEAGLARMSMDNLAKKLGISKVVLYRYFNSKNELINLILSYFVDQVLASDARDSAWGHKLVAENLAIIRQHQSAFLLLIRHTIHDPKFEHHYQRMYGSLVINTVKRLNKDYQPIKNELISVNFFSERLCTFLFDAIKGWIETGDPENDHEFVSWVVESMADLSKSWSEPRDH